MNPIVQKIVNQKISQLTPEELIKHANSYNITLSMNDAKKIIKIIRSEKIDVSNKEQHKKIILQIGKATNPIIAKKINELLNQFY